MQFLPFLLTAAASVSTVSAHFSITYPYWRGNSFPTQWTYPCTSTLCSSLKETFLAFVLTGGYLGGGVNQSVSDTNRTAWPLDGGSLVFMPTHPNAQTFVNLGLGGNVTRLNITLVPTFNQTGNGTFCFKKLTLPSGLDIQEGTNASIQVIQLSENGGALYNVRRITRNFQGGRE